MPELNLSQQTKLKLDEFVKHVKNLYGGDLVSIILYGSASSGEFVEERSDINLLVILENASIINISRIGPLINSGKFKTFEPLFFSKADLSSSADVFPIEFLDMRENYTVLFGIDLLKDLPIELRNLRFQCEHELKSKLILMREAFIRINRNTSALQKMLFRSFTSVIHITRNVLRLKNKVPNYLKKELLTQLTDEFQIKHEVWSRILELKNNRSKIDREELSALYIDFYADLEKISRFVDKL